MKKKETYRLVFVVVVLFFLPLLFPSKNKRHRLYDMMTGTLQWNEWSCVELRTRIMWLCLAMEKLLIVIIYLFFFFVCVCMFGKGDFRGISHKNPEGGLIRKQTNVWLPISYREKDKFSR